MVVKASRIVLTIGVAFATMRCSSPTESLPSGAVPLNPPAIYETWWHEVEQCSGRTGDFAAVSWYYVPGLGAFGAGSDQGLAGLWQPQHNSITVAQFAIEDSSVVTHEELHAILQRTDHPAEYFVQRCGNLVAH